MQPELIARSFILFIIYPFTGFEKLVRCFTPPGTTVKKRKSFDEITSSIEGLFSFPGAARLFLRPVCFKRALLLYYFLKKHGHACSIYFGVKKDGPGLKGHAWVESAAGPIHEYGGSLEGYKIIYKR